MLEFTCWAPIYARVTNTRSFELVLVLLPARSCTTTGLQPTFMDRDAYLIRRITPCIHEPLNCKPLG